MSPVRENSKEENDMTIEQTTQIRALVEEAWKTADWQRAIHRLTAAWCYMTQDEGVRDELNLLASLAHMRLIVETFE